METWSLGVAPGLPPCSLHPDWLGRETADALLDYAVQSEASFQPSVIRRNSERVFDPKVRRSLALTDLGPFADTIAARARQLAPQLNLRFGNGGFEPATIWLELISHGDGDFVRPHIDVSVGEAEKQNRQISMVYYLRCEPSRFRGGELRLYWFGQERFVDVEPRHDLLLAFPSIALHEVNPVSCPGDDFAARRFSVNICLEG
jgi:Rps23 Pro-64 3,4-dihydroxylase Tpa1-like proline 4-hydroxylase